jgi:hypothetical protein
MEVTGSNEWTVSATAIEYGCFGTSETVNIENTTPNCGPLTWSVSDDRSWISVSPTSGSTTTETDVITISVDRSGLEPGPYEGTVTISSNSGQKYITIKMTVPWDVFLELDFSSGTGFTFHTNYWSSMWIKRVETDYCISGSCPSWYGCSGGTLLLRGGGALGEESWVYPSEVGSGNLGLTVPQTCNRLRVDLTNIDLENPSYTQLIVRTNASSPCEFAFTSLSTTCTSKYREGFSSACFNTGSPTEISVVQIDSRTLGDYSVGIQKIRYTFIGWKVCKAANYTGTLQIIPETKN